VGAKVRSVHVISQDEDTVVAELFVDLDPSRLEEHETPTDTIWAEFSTENVQDLSDYAH
jgi:hypothetical protein